MRTIMKIANKAYSRHLVSGVPRAASVMTTPPPVAMAIVGAPAVESSKYCHPLRPGTDVLNV